ncbi:zinc finger protein ZAT11-like [Lathyrus oleraceus]|uniref:zinc finger protein ZAT11-like n=1 Tax=Pisum sativum TaxID=3888 RepID=UPI0021D31E80|nr:zinc finger protein ZAT11-like [Pisum sativum]
MMKRQRENVVEKESMDLATNLMLLSSHRTHQQENNKTYSQMEFECKTCNRKFSSFQALGGHRTSHKKLKLEGDETLKGNIHMTKEPKVHKCSICGQEFKLGQALGGHMRRHRINNEEVSSSSMNYHQVIAKSSPVLKRSNSKRVMCLELDLNLTPLENDLKFLFGSKAPQVDLSLF